MVEHIAATMAAGLRTYKRLRTLTEVHVDVMKAVPVAAVVAVVDVAVVEIAVFVVPDMRKD
jgi:hypothetical protein